MDDHIRFTVSLDDMMDTTRLASRKYTFVGGTLAMAIGLGLAAIGIRAGMIVAVLGLLVFVLWRFPVIDRWLVRRRAAARIDSDCELWLDDSGIAYRQVGLDGHIDLKAITRIMENDRSVILMQGGIGLMAIPLRAFGSPDAATEFLDTVRNKAHLRRS